MQPGTSAVAAALGTSAAPDAPAAAPNGAATVWGELPADVKTFIGEKTPAQIAQELFGAQKLIGKKTIGIPTAESSIDDWKAFHKARGVPDDVAGYTEALTPAIDALLKDAPGMTRDAAREAAFIEAAKGANLSTQEATELVTRVLKSEYDANRASIEAAETSNREAKKLLTDKWGPDEQKLTDQANRFARQMGLTDAELEVFMSAAGTNPQARFNFVNFMAEQGALLMEGSEPGTLPGGGQATMTPDQARQAKETYLNTGNNRQRYLDGDKAVEEQVTKYLRAERGI